MAQLSVIVIQAREDMRFASGRAKISNWEAGKVQLRNWPKKKTTWSVVIRLLWDNKLNIHVLYEKVDGTQTEPNHLLVCRVFENMHTRVYCYQTMHPSQLVTDIKTRHHRTNLAMTISPPPSVCKLGDADTLNTCSTPTLMRCSLHFEQQMKPAAVVQIQFPTPDRCHRAPGVTLSLLCTFGSHHDN